MVTITCSSKLHTALSEDGLLESEAAPDQTVRLGRLESQHVVEIR